MRTSVFRLREYFEDVCFGFCVVTGERPVLRAHAARSRKPSRASVFEIISGKWKRGVAKLRDILQKGRLLVKKFCSIFWHSCASLGAGLVFLGLILWYLGVNPLQVLRQDLNYHAAQEVVRWAKANPLKPLSREQLLTLLAASDWKPHQWGMVIQISFCESSFRPGVVNDKNKPGNGIDGGLMQINSVMKPWPGLMEKHGITFEDIIGDPLLNLNLAYVGYMLDETKKKGSGFSHWRFSINPDGTCRRHLAKKTTAVLPLLPELPPLKRGENHGGEGTQIATQ